MSENVNIAKDFNYIENVTKCYVYDVVRKLPINQRADIESELNTLIEDLLAERVGENQPENKDIDIVLIELGSPHDLAAKYRDSNRCLISPAYYDSYIFLLKIILPVAAFAMAIAGVVRSINEFNGVLEAIITIIFHIISSMLSAFAFITLGFVIAERFNAKIVVSGGTIYGGKTEWAPNMLPPLPENTSIIKKSECIFSIVFSFVVFWLFLIAPQILGLWVWQDGTLLIYPVFNMDIWGSILPLLLLPCVVDIIDQINRLIVGRYNNRVMFTTIITSSIGIILTLILFLCFPVWNPMLGDALNNMQGIKLDSFDFAHFVNSGLLSCIFVGICLFAFLLEIGTAIYHTLKIKRDYRVIFS